MSRLRTALERYIGMRQGLGYKYDGPAKRLSEFVAFMEARGAEAITTDLAMEWVTSMGRQPSWSIRLADVHSFRSFDGSSTKRRCIAGAADKALHL